jgi:hypothetical protein
VDLPKQPRHLPPCLGVQRHQVDDVGPVIASAAAVAEQVRSDRVTVGLVADQDAAEVIASFGVDCLERE